MALPVNIDDLVNHRKVEWARIEYKEGWNPEKVLHALCAFAKDIDNWGGGYIILGIAENAGKLVYDYAGAVSADDTDPSGIDAEASIAKGAKIVYMDSNNSDADFHVRKVASIKK